MHFVEVEGRVAAALDQLLLCDCFLLEVGVGERCLCGRFAMYLQPAFPDHNVDVEYNRHDVDKKSLDLEACGGDVDNLITPDIVIHCRGHDDDNLLALEVKRVSNRASRDCDHAKLVGLTEEYGYRYAAFVDIPDGDLAGEDPRADWYFRDPADAPTV